MYARTPARLRNADAIRIARTVGSFPFALRRKPTGARVAHGVQTDRLVDLARGALRWSRRS